jgi:flagellar protein FliO/FliZ
MININYVNNLVFSLILVLITIVVFAYIYKKSKFSIGGSSNKINILSSLSIGNKEKLILLDVEGKKLLIGATHANIRTLFIKDNTDESSDKFTDHLENIMNRGDKGKC